MKIGLISDTHGWLDPQVFDYFQDRDEIWHAGDIGSLAILDALVHFKPLKAVYGNIDDLAIRARCEEYQSFERNGLRILMVHISGKPPYYTAPVLGIMEQQMPHVVVGGHSHILQIIRDPKRSGLLYLNPGAAGKHGFHQMRTLLRFEIHAGKMSHMQAIELGLRSAI